MRKHRWSVALAPVLVAVLAGCASSNATSEVRSGDFATFNGASVEVVAEGGFAALSTTHRVDHDSRAFTVVQRHLCATNCAAPMDSASGTVSPAAADSLFNMVLARKNGFKDDFGTTPQAADMFVYTVRITSEGTVKTIRADDGTMPDALRQVVDAVRGTIAVARGR